MTAKKTVAFLVVNLVLGAACGQEPYPSRITFRVIDDLGAPVRAGELRVSAFSHWEPGEGFGRDRYSIQSHRLDRDGSAMLEIPNVRGELFYGVNPEGAYYGINGVRYRFSRVTAGRWEPWNPEVVVELARRINPIALYARRVGNMPDLELPARGPVGFDLEVSDWVAPYGQGRHKDFIFEWTEIEPTVDAAGTFESRLSLTFDQPGDGIQARTVTPARRLLDLPREAPEDGYGSILQKRVARARPGAALEADVNEDQNYIFRVRTVLDQQGRVVSAMYGKIYGDLQFFAPESRNGMIRFTYYLNPVDLDRNLEFDPSRNLFPKSMPGTNITEP